MGTRTLIFLIVISFQNLWVLGQNENSFEVTEKYKAIYNDILKLKINTAKVDLAWDSESENGFKIFLENYCDVIQILASEDKILFDSLKKNEANRLKKIKNLNKDSPYYLFIQAEIKLQWALVKLKFGENLKGVWNIRKGYLLLKENEEAFPNFIPNKKSLGAFRILLSTAPQKYQWILGLLNMKGNRELGTKNLETIIQNNNLFALEAKLFKGYIQAYILNEEEEAFQKFQAMHQQQPDNLFLIYACAMIGEKARSAQKAYDILLSAPTTENYCTLVLLDYFKAKLELQLGNYEDVQFSLKVFFKEFQGENHLKDAYYRLFLAHWFLNDSCAFQFLDSVKIVGQAAIEVDKYALKFANTEPLPHKRITKARFLTDGGQYEEAQQLLNQFDEKSLESQKDQVEFLYRKARIYHFTADFEMAIQHYQQVIKNSEELSDYFAPNSALQLGYIYKKEKQDSTQAKVYFEKALTYEDHEYKFGIDQQAKAGLESLE